MVQQLNCSVFTSRAPECAPLKSKMIYASSKDAIKKKFTGKDPDLRLVFLMVHEEKFGSGTVEDFDPSFNDGLTIVSLATCNNNAPAVDFIYLVLNNVKCSGKPR